MSDSEIVDDDEASTGDDTYGEEMAYEPPETEAVQSGDVYGSSETNWFEEFEDHESVAPEGLYDEIDSHWSEELEETDPNHRYGETDPIPDDS